MPKSWVGSFAVARKKSSELFAMHIAGLGLIWVNKLQGDLTAQCWKRKICFKGVRVCVEIFSTKALNPPIKRKAATAFPRTYFNQTIREPQDRSLCLGYLPGDSFCVCRDAKSRHCQNPWTLFESPG
jgi:hypothetical protein